MSFYYFPSCTVSEVYPNASRKAGQYIKEKYEIDPIGCCRPNYAALTPEDTAIVLCNNCAAILEENTEASILFLWQIIDRDPDFRFPDYHGEKMTIQDCWTAFEKREVQETVRSLLKKMNITVVEQKENFEATRFCGAKLLAPCSESNAKLAHQRYAVKYSHLFTPMEPEAQAEYLKKHCAGIETDKTVCYCATCTKGICMGGKRGSYLLELLFPSGS